MERRQREKNNLRRLILDAARDLFVTHGFENVSLRKIADKIEYSPTTIYLHFSSKEEILTTLAEEGFLLLAARLHAVDCPNWHERMRRGAHVYFDFAREQPHYYNIMFELRAEALKETLDCHDRVDVSGKRAFDFIIQCVETGIAGGQVRTDEHPMVLSHVIWASLHGAVSLLLAGRLKFLPAEAQDSFFDGVVENVLRGLSRGGLRGPLTPLPPSPRVRGEGGV